MATHSAIQFAWRRQLYEAIGKKIRECREEHKMTAREVAERIGCSPSTLVNVETGTLPCPVYVLVQIAYLFDTSLDALVPVDCNVQLNEPAPARSGTGFWEKATKVVR